MATEKSPWSSGPTPAFLTGSYAYGTPGPESDLDIVVLVEDGVTEARLAEFADPGGKKPTSDEQDGPSLRFGKLNLILVRGRPFYDLWARGTRELMARRPVTREVAVAYLESLKDDCKGGGS